MKILHITSIINIIVLTISKHHHYPKINLKFIVIIITPIIICRGRDPAGRNRATVFEQHLD